MQLFFAFIIYLRKFYMLFIPGIEVKLSGPVVYSPDIGPDSYPRTIRHNRRETT
jgi:hypothetical protein